MEAKTGEKRKKPETDDGGATKGQAKAEKGKGTAKGEVAASSSSTKRARNYHTWTELLENTPVVEVCPKSKPLIVLQATTTLETALSTLAENNILSAPVVESKEKPDFLGFVDVLDVTGYVVRSWRHNPDRFDDADFVKQNLFQEHIRKVLNFSRVDDAVVIDEASSVADAIRVFTDPEKYHHHHRGSVHRIALMNAETKAITNIVSQSDIIAFAHRNSDLLPNANKTLEELRVMHANILVRVDSPFIDALEILYMNRVSGICLVDQESRVSGNLSASDLRSITPDSFKFFLGSTLQFLVKGTKSKLGAPVSCQRNTALKDALALLVENHVHRIFVVDRNDHTQGVVTLSDLLPLMRA
ncbi:CBS domain containing protein [Balamuthia mandrillaris]